MVLLAQNTNLTACAMQKVLRIQPGWTVFPIWVRTKNQLQVQFNTRY